MKDSISGNTIVDEISKLHINSIPEAWYKTIRMKNQPHAVAILILWDLMYWYKWTEVRDEKSGMVIGYKKKFRDELLQRSYADIAAKFGISKRQATDVITFLQTLGLLKKVFKTIDVNGVKCSNVLYIELIPSKIKEFSSEVNNITNNDSEELKEDEKSQNCDTYHEISGQVSTSERETNTTNTHTNIQTTSNSHCCDEAATNAKQKKSFKNEDYTRVFNAYFANCKTLYDKGVIENEHPVLPVYAKKIIKSAFENFGVDNVVKAVEESINHEWLAINEKYPFIKIFGPNELPNLINKTYKNAAYKNTAQKQNNFSNKKSLEDKIDLSDMAVYEEAL